MTNYAQKLDHVSPGIVIDQLKKDIRGTIKLNYDIRDQIERIEEKKQKTAERTAELELEQKRAMNDRDEMFRDCSTFESRFVRSKKNERLDVKIHGVT